MVEINIFKSPIEEEKIRKMLLKFFSKRKIKNAQVSISFVNKKIMREIRNKYYKKDKNIHKVFSFAESDVVNFPKSDNLGEIIVCYPLIENEKETLELIKHSALHLLGIHHPEE